MADPGSQPSDINLGAAVNALAEGQKAFGRYTLMKIVGRSPVSVVWLAWDEKQDRDVALKFLPEMTKLDASAVATLKREIRKLSESLRHDKIVKFFDLEQDNGLVAIPKEYVEGSSISALRSQKDNQVFAPQDLSDWVQQLCEVLEYAHNEASLAHGELKPSNLIINQKGLLKVTDFGLEPHITAFLGRVTDLPAGTGRNLAYWSPQRLGGSAPSSLDDIYSMGACVYELLTSKPPFYTGDIALQVNQKVPPPMVHRRKELRVIGEPISRIWEETVSLCLSKDASQRPQSIGHIIERLELEAPPSIEVQEPAAAGAGQPAGNNKLMIGVAVAVFALLGVGALVLTSGGGKSGSGGTNTVVQQDTEAIRAAVEKTQKDAAAKADEIKKKADAEAKAANEKVKQAQEQAKKLQAEIDKAKADEAARAAQAEKDRVQAEMKRAAAEAEARRLADEMEKAKKMAAANQSEAEKKALADAAAKVKAAQDEAKRLQMEIDKAKQDEVKKAADAERMRKEAEAKKVNAEAEAKRLAALAELERQRQAAMAAEQARQDAENKRLAEEKAKQEAARVQAEAKAKQEAFERRKFVAGKPWENSIGMRLVPVGDVMFCIWECRISDFQTFASASGYNAGVGWKSPGFKQEDSHPVVNVSYSDAQAFCKWLSEKEANEGLIAGYSYRLPTDVEWSSAVGLNNEPGSTPAERNGKVRAVYPWGAVWPPPPGAGNYADNVSYDRFENTAPVASFMPNQFGIYDLGGNVWEWCLDAGDASKTTGVLRGGAYTGYAPGALYSSYRLMIAPSERRADAGFRCVLTKSR